MPPKKRNRPGERIGLKLTAAERSLLLDGLTGLPAEYEQAVRSTPPAQPVMFVIDDLDDLGEYVAAAASHTPDAGIQRKLPFSEDDEMVQRLALDAPDEPVHVGVEVGALPRQLLDLHALGLEDLVEVPGVLGVPVPEQVRRLSFLVLQRYADVAGLLLDPGGRRVGGRRRDSDLAAADVQEGEQVHLDPPSQGPDRLGEEVAGIKCLRQVGIR